MKGSLVFVVMLVISSAFGCGAKKDKADPNGGGNSIGSGSGSGSATGTTCPPGNAMGKDGKCIVVITAEQVAIVDKQQTRLDELAKLLDKSDVVGAPVELLNGFRQLDVWKQAVAAQPKLKAVDDVIVMLGDAVKQLHVFRDSLASAAVGLGDLKGSLDKVLHDPGVARQLDDLRSQVTAKLHATIDPLVAQVIATIQKVIVPVNQQLSEFSDYVVSACTVAKVTGGSDKLTALCGDAKVIFAKATVFLDDLKTRPGALFDQLTAQLLAALTSLVDTSSKQLLEAAQKQVNDALKLPAAGSGSGSATP